MAKHPISCRTCRRIVDGKDALAAHQRNAHWIMHAGFNQYDSPKRPRCPYCNDVAVFFPNSAPIYGSHKNYGPAWVCWTCQAWVGCHPGTVKPLGRLANASLWKMKVKAHAAFDPLWKSGRMSRSEAYGWLANALGIPRPLCHIGMFNLDRCRKTVAACAAFSKVEEHDAA